VPGSGKTTQGEMLAKKYKVKWYSLDSWWWRLKQKHFKDADHKAIRKKLGEKVKSEAIKKLISNERFIMEGIDLVEMYHENPSAKKLIINEPMIIMGLSAIRSGIRAGMRNKNREGGESWKELYWMSILNIKAYEPQVKNIRKDVMKLPKPDIREFQL